MVSAIEEDRGSWRVVVEPGRNRGIYEFRCPMIATPLELDAVWARVRQTIMRAMNAPDDKPTGG